MEKVRGNLWIRRLYVRHMLLYLHLPAWFEIVFPPAEAVVQRPLHVHQSHHHFTRQYYAVSMHPMARGHQKSIPVPPPLVLSKAIKLQKFRSGQTRLAILNLCWVDRNIYSSENENTLLKKLFSKVFYSQATPSRSVFDGLSKYILSLEIKSIFICEQSSLHF